MSDVVKSVVDLFDSTGYVIKAKEDNIFSGCYLTHGDAFSPKIKSARVFNDREYAQHELELLCKRNKGFEAYQENLLKILPVTITEIKETDLLPFTDKL